MNSSDYIIDFTIPQGPTGPTGPSSDYTRAFGYLANQAEINSIFLPNQQKSQIVFPITLAKLNTFYTNNMIGFLNNGAYAISYSILLQVPDATVNDPVAVTTYLRLNGVSTITPLTRVITDNSSHYFSNTVILNEEVNNTIDILISADKAKDWSYTVSFLSAVKISEEASA
jgi:hypothetical protein